MGPPRADRSPTRTPWGEEAWGYSRAVRVGDRIEVSGTAAWTDDGQPVAPGDAYQQTVEVLGIIDGALRELGATLADVIRTRVYLTNIEDFRAVGRAHGGVFRDTKPASTCVEVSALLHPDLRVEIEAVAVASRPG